MATGRLGHNGHPAQKVVAMEQNTRKGFVTTLFLGMVATAVKDVTEVKPHATQENVQVKSLLIYVPSQD